MSQNDKSEQPTERDLTTTRTQVFGDVDCGTECRVCGRNVTDGRSKTCSDYCNNLLSAVMGMVNWSSVRRRVIDRDDETCQHCGFDMGRERLARDHIRSIIDERAGDRPKGPGALEMADRDDIDYESYIDELDEWNERRDELKRRFGDPYEHARSLEVDHIERVADGGHPFDPANLQTLCSECHQDKTARENSEQGRTPSRNDLNESLFEFVSESTGEVEQ